MKEVSRRRREGRGRRSQWMIDGQAVFFLKNTFIHTFIHTFIRTKHPNRVIDMFMCMCMHLCMSL